MRDKNTVRNAFKISTFLHNRKRKDGHQYIMYRVYLHANRYIYATGFTTLPQHWSETKGQVTVKHPDHNRINSDIASKISTAQKAIALADINGDIIKADTLASLFTGGTNKIKVAGLIEFIDEIVSEMRAANKIGTGRVYHDLRNSIKTFLKSEKLKIRLHDYRHVQPDKKQKVEVTIIEPDLSINDLDYTFLQKFKNHLERRTYNGQPLKPTTLSNRFRTLRAVYNEAMKRKLVDRENYPFSDFKVSQFSVETKPRAISKLEIKALERLDLPRESFLWDARNFFLFSYYGCGINFVDLAQLRWQDIDGNHISYIRQKTGRAMKLEILPNLREMLDAYEPFTGGHPTNYIFPILNTSKHKTRTQIDNRIDKVDKRISKALRELCKTAGIQKVTFYVARHTCANELQLAGVPVSIIAQILGHDERVTKTYLKKISDKQTFEVLNNLF